MKNKNQLFFEIMVPVLLVAIGLIFSKVEFFYSSPPKEISADAYVKEDLMREIVFNDELLIQSCCDIQPEDLMAAIPDGNDSFVFSPYINTNRPQEAPDMLAALEDFDGEL